jgi:hypothetical protein
MSRSVIIRREGDMDLVVAEIVRLFFIKSQVSSIWCPEFELATNAMMKEPSEGFILRTSFKPSASS